MLSCKFGSSHSRLKATDSELRQKDTSLEEMKEHLKTGHKIWKDMSNLLQIAGVA